MTYKFLSFLFFCGVCVSAFGQELQSPQISQNAIFANPGLAGSKGVLRLNTSATYYIDSYHYNQGNSQKNKFQNRIINTLVSGDGLIWKNRIGVGVYFKNETNNIHKQYSFVNTSGQEYDKKYIIFNYHNIYAGIMVAPKFYIGAKDSKKIGRTLSPALGLGFKTTQLNYTGSDTIHNKLGPIKAFYNGLQTTYSVLDYVSLGLIYSSPKSYIGMKINFKQFQTSFSLSDISFVVAKSFYNKKVTTPDFSFNPQLYIAIPIYAANRSNRYLSYIDRQNAQLFSSMFSLNLDFRYKKFLFGNFFDLSNYNGVFLGLFAGVQLQNMKIMANYSFSGSKNTGSVNGLFLSANFYLKGKKERYK